MNERTCLKTLQHAELSRRLSQVAMEITRKLSHRKVAHSKSASNIKLFKTTDMKVVRMCREHFDFVLPSLQLDRRRRSFVGSPVTTDLIKLVFA